MKRFAVALLVMLLTGCSGSPSQRPKTKAHATTTVASPSSTTTTTSTTSITAASTTTALAGARACAADDLVIASIDGDGASGHNFSYVRLRNVGTAPCSMSGFPNVTGRTRDGVALVDVHNGSYQPDPKAGDVSPGSSGVVILDSYNRCSDDYPDKPIRTYIDLHLGLPGGGVVSLGDFAVGPTCLVSVSQLGLSS